MASDMSKDEGSIEDVIKKLNENPQYKVLTREEYDSLIAIASNVNKQNKNATPNKKTPEPRASTPGSPEAVKPSHPGAKPKFTFQYPGISPVPRLQYLNNSQLFNNSYMPQSYHVPKLPFFSGSEEPQKGEVTYEVWNFEVKCLQNAHYLPDHIILQAMRNSLKGAARTMLVPLGRMPQ